MDFCDLLKPCTGCKEILLKTEFNKDAGKEDGLQTQCRACKRAAQRKDYQKKKDVYADRRRAAYKKSPEKKSAHEAVRRAIKKGVLTRPKACTKCGESHMRIEAHHHKGYAKEHQLDVVFLCTSCHRASE
jgi:DNA-directed RNA polymerase subunit M/transcription elongation factor TFIIS